MKNIILTMENEKMEALNFYLEKSGKTLQAEMEERLKEIYEKEVPEQAREYIEFKEKNRVQAKDQSVKERKGKRSIVEKQEPSGTVEAVNAVVRPEK